MDIDQTVWIRRIASSGGAKAIREGAGLSMGEVAREAGCSVSAISRWESGERTPRGDAAERWAALLRRLSG
jgi:transcriptional regulator with XRE-family HTH domain